MRTLASKSGNSNVNFIDMDRSSSGGEGRFTTNAEDVNPDNINAATDFSKGSHINIYRDAFSEGWSHLTEVVIHEYGHAYSRYNGIFQGFYNKNGLGRAYAQDEVFAYQWQSCFGFSMFYPNSNIYISGLTQAINRL